MSQRRGQWWKIARVWAPAVSFLLTGCEISIAPLNPGPPPPPPPPAVSVGGVKDHVFPSNYIDQYVQTVLDFNDYGLGWPNDIAITYSCVFDRVVDGEVNPGTSCLSLPGLVSFDTSQGVLTWTPNLQAFGAFELKVTGSAPGRGTSSAVVVVDVREPYTLSHLSGDYNALFSNLTAPAPNSQSSWSDLSGNGFDGSLLSCQFSAVSGFNGSGTAASPYRLAINFGHPHADFGSSIVPASQNALMFSSWLEPALVTANSDVILGNGAGTGSGTGNGFVLKQSDTLPSHLELQIGKQLYSALVLADAPVSYWRLGEFNTGQAAADSAGANPGTYAGGVTFSGGVLATEPNTAAVFDGVTGKVTMGSVTTGAAFSLEAWIVTGLAIGEQPIFSNRTTGSLYVGTNGGKFFIWDTSGAPNGMFSSASVSDSQVHHVVYTSDGATSVMYIDGNLDSTLAKVRASSSGNSNIAWDSSNATEFFKGLIDEVAIYNYPLTQGQVKAHYDAGRNGIFYAGKVLSWQPRGFWRLGESSGAVAYDISTNGNNGVYTANASLGQPGALATDSDASASLAGGAGTSIMSVAAPASIPAGGAARSISAWVYPTAYTGTIVGWGDGLIGSGHQQFNFELAQSGPVYLFSDGINNGNNLTIAGAQVPPLNTWSHVAFTLDGSNNWTYYLDGVAQANGTFGTPINTVGTTLTVGNRADQSTVDGPFSGRIDEVAVFDYALSAQQISELFSSSSFTKCLTREPWVNNIWTFVGGVWDGTKVSLVVNGRTECSVTASGTFTNPPAHVFLGADPSLTSPWPGSVADVKLYSSGTAADVATNFAASAERFRATSEGDIVLSNLIVNLDAANSKNGMGPHSTGCATADLSWSDLTTNALDATLSGFTACGADGWQGAGTSASPFALKFNHGTDHVPVTLTGLNTAAGTWNTVELWMKWGGTDWVMPFGFNDYNLFFFSGGFGFNSGNGEVYGVSSAPLNGAWTHVVAEFFNGLESSNVLFINGVQQTLSLRVGAGPIARNATVSAEIAGWPNDQTTRFDGSIAVVRVYKGQLTQAQVSQNCKALASRFSGVSCN